jgi:hypothetical protein
MKPFSTGADEAITVLLEFPTDKQWGGTAHGGMSNLKIMKNCLS